MPFEIRDMRKKAGMTQGVLAKMIGVSVMRVSLWERGERVMSRTHELAFRYVLQEMAAGRMKLPRGAGKPQVDREPEPPPTWQERLRTRVRAWIVGT